ncbi:MAG: GNAT superfamily N-acetyltransferase [Myxococcota bacterium]|jgi:GNAT superfamily N-acetyltransferase
MTRGDLPAVLELWHQLMANGMVVEPRWSLSATAGAWMAGWVKDVFLTQVPFPHGHVYVDEDGIAGFVSGFPDPGSPVLDEPKSLRIGDVFVAERARRQGVGRRLVEQQIMVATAVGYHSIIVETLTRDVRAVAFWRAIGFDDMRVQLRRYDD